MILIVVTVRRTTTLQTVYNTVLYQSRALMSYVNIFVGVLRLYADVRVEIETFQALLARPTILHDATDNSQLVHKRQCCTQTHKKFLVEFNRCATIIESTFRFPRGTGALCKMHHFPQGHILQPVSVAVHACRKKFNPPSHGPAYPGVLPRQGAHSPPCLLQGFAVPSDEQGQISLLTDTAAAPEQYENKALRRE